MIFPDPGIGEEDCDAFYKRLEASPGEMSLTIKRWPRGCSKVQREAIELLARGKVVAEIIFPLLRGRELSDDEEIFEPDSKSRRAVDSAERSVSPTEVRIGGLGFLKVHQLRRHGIGRLRARGNKPPASMIQCLHV